MSKISIKYSIINNDTSLCEETSAIILDEVIKYKEKDGTKVIFDRNINTLVRENDKLRLKYNFNKNNGEILLKDINNKLKLNIKTNNIERKGNDIKIEFNVEDELFKYQIEVIT